MECNRIEKHKESISPSDFKIALEELKLLNIFKKHPISHFKLYTALSFDCTNKLFIKNENVAVKKLIKLYGLEERYKNIKNKCFNILWNIIRNSDVKSPESLERLLENMASRNWYEVNDGYSLNNSPHIWQEFIEWYDEVTSNRYEFEDGHIEGFVIEDSNGYMVKVKLAYYNFWKFMRSISHETITKGHTKKTSALTSPLANVYYAWIKNLVATKGSENIPKDICSLRKMFYEEKLGGTNEH